MPYASACGGRYSREPALGYLPTPTAAPAHWQAEKEQNQKAAVGGKKNRLFAGTKRVVAGGPSPATRSPSPVEGTEKLKPTIKLKVDDGETAVLPFIICLF